MNRLSEAVKISEQHARGMQTVAHHYDHADQVRKYAIEIASSEGLSPQDIAQVELAALWHDIGLDYVEDRYKHPEKAAELFGQTFSDEKLLNTDEKENIAFLINYHDKYKEAQSLCNNQRLLQMLRILIDADTLELLGERGYERAKETVQERNWPDYDPNNPRGETYGFSSDKFDLRFAAKRSGQLADAIEPTLIGQLNFQISCADLLFTHLAKVKGTNGVEYLKHKIENIVSNITN